MDSIPQVQELVMFDGEQLVTDSRVLAKTFGKHHKNVLRAYDNLDCSDEFSRLNFEPREYIDERGKAQRSVTMTKDGFTWLAMGFTGRKAKPSIWRAPAGSAHGR
jgi:Rha family phage regulatory protein